MDAARWVDKAITFHCVRHTYASNMIDNGVDVKTVSALLGHTDVSTTLDIYVHPSTETKRLAINKAMKNLL